jgi:chromate transporter
VSERARTQGSIGEVLLVFLRLGCTSFGGPIAHLGYFQRELVARRKWCSESTLAELIALAQSLPGPASSQVGFALGIVRAGWFGGLAAWVGFTLPSALLMLAFASGSSLLSGKLGAGLVHGLQLAAVAVVAQAVLAMQRSLAPELLRIAIAMAAACIALFAPSHFSTVAAIGAGAVAGFLASRAAPFAPEPARAEEQSPLHLPKAAGIAAAAAFLVLLLLPRFFHGTAATVFSAFYRSGALVFGGGHVVLPLLENAVVRPGWVTQPSFLAGYGAAQALPGPLFAFGAYLGASVRPGNHPLLYGLLGLLGLFMPGLLAMAAVLPFWAGLRAIPSIRAALQGINASVVGILLAALIQPLWTSTVRSISDFWIVLLAFVLSTIFRLQPLIVVAVAALLGIVMELH